MKVRAFLLFSLYLLLGTVVLLQTPGSFTHEDAPTAARLQARTASAAIPAAPKHQLVQAYGKLPLSFEANNGQADPQVKFLSHGRGYTLFLTSTEAVLSLRLAQSSPGAENKLSTLSQSFASVIPRLSRAEPRDRAEGSAFSKSVALRIKLVDANAQPKVSGLDELPGKSNYFIGNDPKRWRTNVPHFRRVRYEQVYPGIDLVYYGTSERELEFDLVVAPGADPSAIHLAFEGTDSLVIDSQGDLVVGLPDGELRFRAPHIYQPRCSPTPSDVCSSSVALVPSEAGGFHSAPVPGGYRLLDDNRVAFGVGPYDRSQPLLLDPVLVYSTYLGGSGSDRGNGIAVDGNGNAYVTGETTSTNFPTASALQVATSGDTDVFVTKLNPTGSALVYSTYLGGSSADRGRPIAVDSSGNVFVAGDTWSSNFPTTPGAFQVANAGLIDGFVTKLDATGSALIYSTYLGGSHFDQVFALAIDASGNAYVTGETFSTNFPTANPFQAAFGGGGPFGPRDAFATKLNGTASALVYSTYLGGSDDEQGHAIAVDAAGNAYLAGVTLSTNFPTLNALQSGLLGFADVFVTKFNPTGSALVYSTYLGGSGDDRCTALALDPSGNVYLTGFTMSPDFPTTSPFQGAFGGGLRDVFVSKLNPAGSALLYSTYLGGSGDEQATSIAIDATGNTYVTGYTASANFPTTAGALQTALGGGLDAFVSKVDGTGSALVYSTYLGGSGEEVGTSIAIDATGNAYVTAETQSADFPTTSGAFQTAMGGGTADAFVAKLGPLVVDIDIKPGSFPNSINLRSRGTVPVAIFTTPTFDATTVDPLTVTLAGAQVRLKGKGTPMASFQDVNGDGLLDLVVHVSTEALQLSQTDIRAVLEGKTFSGQEIRGTDSVRIVP